MSLNFINRAGARIEGSLNFGAGNDTFTLEAGSVVTGNFDGGGGVNTLNLSGAAGSSDSLAGTISNFSTLNKTGEGLWTLSGVMGNASGNLAVSVQQGTLALSGNNTSFRGTALVGPAGTLEARAQSLPQSLTNNGLVRFAQPDSGTYAGIISGTGAVEKTGAGALLLTGANTYSGGTTVKGGTLSAGSDNVLGQSTGGLTLDGGALSFANSFTLNSGRALAVTSNNGGLDVVGGAAGIINQTVSGPGQLSKTGAGTLTLNGKNTYSGATHVTGGSLFVNGDQTAATGATDVASGATLGGSGTIGGSVSLANGATLAPGSQGTTPGVLAINGDLNFSSGSILNFSLGQAGVVGGPRNDLVNVNGNLLLDGTLNTAVSPGGTYGAGLYRLINYTGTLIDNGLALGSMPAGSNYVQTSVAGQVNVVNSAGMTLSYWDGAAAGRNDGRITGGDGRWLAGTGNDNWTDVNGALNAPFADRLFAVFSGAPGTVTVDNSLGGINVAGLQFANDGYLIQGDSIALAGTAADPTHTIIRVGDGTAQGANYTSTINSVLTGTSALVKADAGTLVLNGVNTYTGGTAIGGGTVRISRDANLGDAAGALGFDGGALDTTATLMSNRTISLAAGGGILMPAAGTSLTLAGAINGTGKLAQKGPGTVILTGANTYSGGTTIAGGTLQLGSGGTSGSVIGDILNNAVLAVSRADDQTLAGIISGTGRLEQRGPGRLLLTGVNTFSGGTTIKAGTLAAAADSALGFGMGGVTLDGGAFSFADSFTLGRWRDLTITGNNGALDVSSGAAGAVDQAITGIGQLSKTGSGVLTLNGKNSYSGATHVSAGSLFINGDQSAAKGATDVGNGATLGGNGTLGGSVTLADGATLAPGAQGATPGMLTINGNLNLSSGSALDYSLGQAGVVGGPLNDLITVNGDLRLDGTLNAAVSPGGTFGPGLYRLINYTGKLTYNGLALGAMPAAFNYVQSSVAGQVNLVNTTGVTLSYWDGAAGGKNDGAILGGNGRWQAATGNDNWTDASGSVNSSFGDRLFAIFNGAPGTVTADNSLGAINVAGMQFANDGYLIQGDSIALTGTTADPAHTIIRVGDGTANGATYTSVINSVLTGASQLVKADAGTLVLNGVNTYSGGTAIGAGTVQVSSDANLGEASGALRFDGGTLRSTASLISNRVISLDAGGGVFTPDAGTTLTLANALGGNGALTQNGLGTLVLAGTGAYTGGTTISRGALQVGNGGTSGSIVGNVLNNGVLVVNRSDALTLGGTLSGTGALVQRGTGTTTLTGSNTYSGGTTIASGTLQLGDGGATGSLTGDVLNNAALVFNRAGLLSLDGLISGSGSLMQQGPGITLLTAANRYSGTTSVNAGSLFVNGNQSAATGLTTVNSGGTLGGIGTIGGAVNVADGGTLAPGDSNQPPGTLTIQGALTLSSGAILDYHLGEAGVPGGAYNDLTQVNGNLVLDGTLNVAATPGRTFDPGIYRLISYKGALTDNGLSIGTLPSANYSVQTSVANQVNLINTAGKILSIWDGAGTKGDGVVSGGDGTWQATGGDNWTDPTGTTHPGYVSGSFAVFEGDAGTVTIDNSKGNVATGGMQFANDGYTLKGDALTLTGGSPDPTRTIIRVGDGTAAGKDITATIDNVLQGSTTLVKTDLGTLVLNGDNTYTGGTEINGGTLRISRDQNLGDPSGGLTFDGGALSTSANVTSNRAITVNDGGVTLKPDANTTLTLNGNIVGTGGLTQDGKGTSVLNGQNSYAGPTTVKQGTLVIGDAAHPDAALTGGGLTTINVGTTAGGYGSIKGQVDNFGTLAVGNATPGSEGGPTGNFVINGKLNNSGNVALGGTPVGNTLKVNDYVGKNGTLTINTVLGDDNSPTDRLIIDGGRASGNTRLLVNNVGGVGALTLGNGIQVVSTINGGTTAPDAFSLGKRVIGGPYEYRLYRGARDGSSPEDWYLRSQRFASGDTPEYRSEVSDYAALSSMMLQYGRQTMGSMQDRVGSRGDAQGQVAAQEGGWIRAIGQSGKWNAKTGGIYSEGPSFDLNVGAVQGGTNLFQLDQANGSSDRAGVYGVVGEGSGGVQNYDGRSAGTNSFKAASLGGYWTHRTASTAYLDTVLQGTWYYDAKSGAQKNHPLKTSAAGLAASLEGGVPFTFANQWSIEPQAQLVYQGIKVADSHDTAAKVSFGPANSVSSRVGVKVAKQLSTASGHTLSAWVRPSVWHEFSANPQTSISSPDGDVPFHSNQRGTWSEVAAGVSLPLSKNMSFYSTLGYQKAVENGIQSMGGTAGIRVSW